MDATIEQASRYWSKDDIKEALKVINDNKEIAVPLLNASIDLVQCNYSLKSLETLRKHIDTIKGKPLDKILEYSENCDSKEVQDIIGKLVTKDLVKKSDSLKNDIVSKLSENYDKKCETLIERTAYKSILFGIVQFYQLYRAHQTIKAADNVVKESRQKFDQVGSCIEKIKNELRRLISDVESNVRNRRLYLSLAAINTYHRNGTQILDKVRVDINGKIQELNLCAENAVVNGITNSVSFITQAMQLASVKDNITKATATLGLVSLVINAIHVAGNAYNYKISQDMIAELQEELRRVHHYESELLQLHERIEAITDSTNAS